jgi:N-acetyl-gamma-glutamyl-phosphate reductase
MINAGIIGGSGYTGGELIRLLINHPEVTIDFIYSRSQGGKSITSVHDDLLGETDLQFSSEVKPDIDVLFLCTGHGNSAAILAKHHVAPETRIVDLSRDFRLNGQQSYRHRQFIYGLPELQKDALLKAKNVANPGCFATAIQLALLPLAQESELQHDLHIHGITGSTGAGSSLSTTTHFSWRDSNVSVYKALNHQHVPEVKQSIKQLSDDFDAELHFVPMRGSFTRGIFISAYTRSDLPLENAQLLFKEFYIDSPFVYLSPEPLHLKQVVNTNKCLLHLQKKNGQLMITCIIDNLLKGASGQAVQNMNLMFGLDETNGLLLKPTHF